MSDFSNNVMKVRAAVATLNEVPEMDEVSELITVDEHLRHEVLGQLLMNHLPIEGMGFANKHYWLAVAEHMGPDFTRAFRHVGAFMAKADEF